MKAIKRNKVLEKALLRSSSPELINTDHNNYSSFGSNNNGNKSSLVNNTVFPGTSTERLVYASMLINDARRGRSTAMHLKSSKALLAYKQYSSPEFRNLIFLTCWILLILTFFEGVSYKLNDEIPSLLSLSVTSPIEVICTFIFGYNCYLEYVYLGSNFKSWWRENTAVYTTIAVCLMILDICICLSPTPFPRFSKPLRPLFMLTRMRHVRESVVGIINSTPAIIVLLTLMVFFILFGGLLGWLIFDPELSPWDKIKSNATGSGLCSAFSPFCNSYFAQTPDAIYQSTILLTGANFPSIMLPYFHEAGWSAGFFVCHVTFGFYFLNRLLVAAAFSSYKRDTRKRIERTMRLRNMTIKRAFEVLIQIDDDYNSEKNNINATLSSTDNNNNNNNNNNTASDIINNNGNNNNLLTLGQWIKLCKFDHYSNKFFLQHALRMVGDNRSDSSDRSISRNSLGENLSIENKAKVLFNCIDYEKIGKIDQYQFVELCNYLGFKIKAKNDIAASKHNNSYRSYFSALVKNRYFQYFFDIIVIISVTRMLLLRSHAASITSMKNKLNDSVDYISYVLASLFGVEIVCKIYALGFKEYWSDLFNRLDFFVVWPTLTGTVFLQIIAGQLNQIAKQDTHHKKSTLFSLLFVVRLLRIFRVFRVVRLLRFSKVVWRVLISFAKTLPILQRFLVILMSVMYAFAVIGMEYFCTCLDMDIPAVAKSSYAYQGLQALNFKTFGDSLTITFVMLMNRKFPAIMEGTIAGCNSLVPMVYYFSYYIIAVQILTSVFVAFVIEAYSSIKSQEDDNTKEQDLEDIKNEIKLSIRHVLNHQEHVDGDNNNINNIDNDDNNIIDMDDIEEKYIIEHALKYVDLLKSTTRSVSSFRRKHRSNSPKKQRRKNDNLALNMPQVLFTELRQYNTELRNLLINEYGCDPTTHPLLKKIDEEFSTAATNDDEVVQYM